MPTAMPKTTAVCGAKAMPRPKICFFDAYPHLRPSLWPNQINPFQPKAKATSARLVIDVSEDEVEDVSSVSGCQTKEGWATSAGLGADGYIQKRRAHFEQAMETLRQQPGFEQAQEKLKHQRKKLAPPPGETSEERDVRQLQEDWEHLWKIGALQGRQMLADERHKASLEDDQHKASLEQEGHIKSLEDYRAGLEPDDGVGAWLKKKVDEDYEDYEVDPRTGSEDGPAPEPEDAAMDWKQDAAGCRWKKRELEAVGAVAIGNFQAKRAGSTHNERSFPPSTVVAKCGGVPPYLSLIWSLASWWLHGTHTWTSGTSFLGACLRGYRAAYDAICGFPVFRFTPHGPMSV